MKHLSHVPPGDGGILGAIRELQLEKVPVANALTNDEIETVQTWLEVRNKGSLHPALLY